MKILHLADLHPDSMGTLAGKLVLDPNTGRSVTLTDLWRSLDWVFNEAIEPGQACDVAVMAGDIFDSHHPSMDEVKVMLDFVLRLREAMPVVMIAGNHDINQSDPSAATALEVFKGHGRVYVFDKPGSMVMETLRIDCLPFPTKGRILAQAGMEAASPEEVNHIINQGLWQIVEGFQLMHTPEEVHVLLAHGTVASATVGRQPRSIAHDIHLPLEAFQAYDYVALGHIHKPQQVASNAWYCGALMRQDFGEEGEPKGANVITISPKKDVHVVHLSNPHARLYKTVTLEEFTELEWQAEGVWMEHCYRIKDEVTREQLQSVEPLIEKWRRDHPYTQNNLEVIKEDRSRNPEITTLITPEQCLMSCLKDQVGDEELPALLSLHEAISSGAPVCD